MCEIEYELKHSHETNELIKHLQEIRNEQEFVSLSLNNEDTEESIAHKILVRKPNNSEYVRVMPESVFVRDVAVVRVDGTETTYFIDNKDIVKVKEARVMMKRLHFAINSSNQLFMWPIKVQYGLKALDSWNVSATHALSMAITKWIRLSSNVKCKSYEVLTSEKPIEDPIWPTWNWNKVADTVLAKATISSHCVADYLNLLGIK